MLTVHHLNNSRSQRILWLLEELGIAYEIKHYRRTADQLAPKELLQITPLGQSPAITDDSVTLAESGAIIEYLISKYGEGRFQVPISSPGHLHNLYFAHYAEGTLMPTLVQKFFLGIIAEKTPFFIRPIFNAVFNQVDLKFFKPAFQKNFSMIEKHLDTVKTGWFAGGEDPTAADFQMAFPLEAVVAKAPEVLKDAPKILEYVDRVHNRPAYKRALEKGGEYDYKTS